MEWLEIRENKKQYLDLLLLGDEQEDRIDTYLSRGILYVLNDGGVKNVCVVTDEGDGILEIKNIATKPEFQHQGYGEQTIRFLIRKYRGIYRILQAGTGDGTQTVRFYEKCGFVKSHWIKNFFLDYYDHPIFEDGIQLKDMIYLRKNI